MKAARFGEFGGPEVLEIVDLPDPHAGPGQIRIAVRAAGINATDWKVRQGLKAVTSPDDRSRRGRRQRLGVGIGSTAVRLAIVRGARVIGTAGPANHDDLRSLGAEPVAYGPGLVDRVRALGNVDRALDVAGSGVLPELIELAELIGSGRFSLPVERTFPSFKRRV